LYLTDGGTSDIEQPFEINIAAAITYASIRFELNIEKSKLFESLDSKSKTPNQKAPHFASTQDENTGLLKLPCLAADVFREHPNGKTSRYRRPDSHKFQISNVECRLNCFNSKFGIQNSKFGSR